MLAEDERSEEKNMNASTTFIVMFYRNYRSLGCVFTDERANVRIRGHERARARAHTQQFAFACVCDVFPPVQFGLIVVFRIPIRRCANIM